MKTKMKKAAKPMMRKSGKVLPKHQTVPGEVYPPYGLRQMLERIKQDPRLMEAYEKTYGQDWRIRSDQTVDPKTRREMRKNDPGRENETETPFETAVKQGSSAQDTNYVERRHNYFTGKNKKGGSVVGKPMMKKSTSMKSKSSKNKKK